MIRSKQKTATSKKAAAVVAIVLVAALLTGSAFAFTDFGQSVINKFYGSASPGAILHDDFEPEVNKDVYVENAGDAELIVRVRFTEYLQIGNYPIVGTDPADKTTWVQHDFPSDAMVGTSTLGEFDGTHVSEAHDYFAWLMSGAEKVYKPGTGNMGNYEYEVGDVFDDGTVATTTLPSNPVITMAEYVSNKTTYDAEVNGRWILDEDGWAYWSKLLAPNTATNMLLDNVEKILVPDDNYYYAIDVIMQVSNKTEHEDMKAEGGSDDGKDLIDYLAEQKNILVVMNGPSQIEQGGNGSYKANVSGSTEGVTWTLDGDDLTGITIDQNGVVTIDPSVPEGTPFVVIATSKEDDTKSASKDVVVVAPTDGIKSLTVAPKPLVGLLGQIVDTTYTATATGVGTFSSAVTWSISPAVKGISINASTGVVSIAKDVEIGTKYTVKATSVEDSKVTATTQSEVCLPITATFFPDDAFRGFIADKDNASEINVDYPDVTCDQDNNDLLQASEIEVITRLWVQGPSSSVLGDIESVQGVEYLTALQDFRIHQNKIASVDLSKNTELTTLEAGYNQLQSLDLSKNIKLTSLGVYSNLLTELDVEANTNLTSISAWGNQLTTLDVTKNTRLTFLDFGDNDISSIDLSKNLALLDLRCYDNNFTGSGIDISLNTNLKNYFCGSNQLTSLNLSTNTALKILSCYSNKITALDLSANTALTRLDGYDNKIASLNISMLTDLAPTASSFKIYGNTMTSLTVNTAQNVGDLLTYTYNAGGGTRTNATGNPGITVTVAP